ncbi:hypothetical protein ABES02_28635 [Neobacillus pocheonensis]|uniref:hypothetical protein n=1 Tax=Neobacillus pocheonensis TaxID=363869 RepID=UPI003D2C498A
MKAKMENYIRKKLNIDPESDEIGWYVNHETEKFVTWRFTYRGNGHRVTYDRKTKKITSGPYIHVSTFPHCR